MGKITIKDVAAMAGVSVGTVSMTLNNSPKISEATKKNVMEIVEKLGYRRDPYARSFSLSSSRSIGFIAPGFVNPFFGEVAEALQATVEEKNNSLMFGISNDSAKQEAKLIDQFLDRGVDGLIIIPAEDVHPDLTQIKRLLSESFPMVFLTSYYKELPYHTVMADLASGSYELTRSFISAGLKNIIIITGSPDLIPFSERIYGFRRAFDEVGLPFDESRVIISDGMSYEGGYAAIDRIFDERKPDGILAINDMMAMGAMKAFSEAGMEIGKDVLVVGFDNILIGEYLQTPLSTIDSNIALETKKYVSYIFDENIDESPIKSKFIGRESSGK